MVVICNVEGLSIIYLDAIEIIILVHSRAIVLIHIVKGYFSLIDKDFDACAIFVIASSLYDVLITIIGKVEDSTVIVVIETLCLPSKPIRQKLTKNVEVNSHFLQLDCGVDASISCVLNGNNIALSQVKVSIICLCSFCVVLAS
jgi:hypothetical protein